MTDYKIVKLKTCLINQPFARESDLKNVSSSLVAIRKPLNQTNIISFLKNNL